MAKEVEFHRKKLDNGLTVIFEGRKTPVVAVASSVKFGAQHESAKIKGISHFIEHLLYKGTPTRSSKKIAEAIERNGGELNGFTDESITAYWCKMPSKHLDIALDVLSDMVKNPLFDEKELEKERQVIFEEIKMRKDSPKVYVFDKIQSYLYGGTLGKSLIGTYDTMNSITREQICQKFKQVYQPNNLILGIVGDADFETIVNFAEKNFGKIHNNTNNKSKLTELKIEIKNESKLEKRKGIDQANLIFAHHVPLAKDKKSYAAMALITLMAGGMSSRLFTEIREKRNLAYAVKGDSDINKLFAYNLIYVGTTTENVEKIKKIILEEFKKVAEGLTEEELNQTKEQLIGNYDISMEDSQIQLINLIVHEMNGNAKDFYNFVKNISNVKLEDVKDLAKIKNYSFFALVPE